MIENGKGTQTEYLVIPKLDEIEKMSISEITKLRITIVKYEELLARIIRERLS